MHVGTTNPTICSWTHCCSTCPIENLPQIIWNLISGTHMSVLFKLYLKALSFFSHYCLHGHPSKMQETFFWMHHYFILIIYGQLLVKQAAYNLLLLLTPHSWESLLLWGIREKGNNTFYLNTMLGALLVPFCVFVVIQPGIEPATSLQMGMLYHSALKAIKWCTTIINNDG